MPMKKGNKKKTVYYSPREWEIVQKKAAEAQCRVGTYIRNISVEGEVRIFDLAVLSDLQMELNRIGTNINQIALVVNSTRQFYKNDIEQLSKDFAEIQRNVTRALNDFTGQSKMRG